MSQLTSRRALLVTAGGTLIASAAARVDLAGAATPPKKPLYITSNPQFPTTTRLLSLGISRPNASAFLTSLSASELLPTATIYTQLPLESALIPPTIDISRALGAGNALAERFLRARFQQCSSTGPQPRLFAQTSADRIQPRQCAAFNADGAVKAVVIFAALETFERAVRSYLKSTGDLARIQRAGKLGAAEFQRAVAPALTNLAAHSPVAEVRKAISERVTEPFLNALFLAGLTYWFVFCHR